ncbi:hypothetical protein F0562_007880 [Nyssa sinensis]|uniref:Hyaluronan/mRNA-binding protein domain-containing protein n=1 Tax=Nyssa sinensis TaxID=561372 RepID=A0A5J5A698_9ASTE|nr:hypothetical protein F0562_007880 [Nyssa sinensis]
MATTNPFDLLGDDDNDDPSQLIAAAQQQKLALPPKKSPAPAQAAAAQQVKPAKLPSKPLPPAQAVKEARNEGQRGRGRGGGRGLGRGRGGGGFNRDLVNNQNTFGSIDGFSGGYKPLEEGDGGRPSEGRGYGGPRGGFRGGRRGGFSNGEEAEVERPRRAFERHSGSGRGSEIKRDGSGYGNWGSPTDEIALETEEPVNENEKKVDSEKQLGQEDAGDTNKENPVNEPEKEPEEKEMTLEEYEKLLEEKRKALLALKTEERKVGLDKDLESMQLLSSKKGDDDIFIKLGSDKDKRKEAAEKEERAKKSVSINEFLKPAEGERYNNPGGRGRGRGRGSRGGFSGSNMMNVGAPSIEDIGQFPSLSAK